MEKPTRKFEVMGIVPIFYREFSLRYKPGEEEYERVREAFDPDHARLFRVAYRIYTPELWQDKKTIRLPGSRSINISDPFYMCLDPAFDSNREHPNLVRGIYVLSPKEYSIVEDMFAFKVAGKLRSFSAEQISSKLVELEKYVEATVIERIKLFLPEEIVAKRELLNNQMQPLIEKVVKVQHPLEANVA